MLNVRGVKDVRALQKIAVEETRLGIPIFWFDVIHGYNISPIPLAESASWDMEAIKDQQQWLQGGFAVGLNWTLHLWLMFSRCEIELEGAGEDAFRK
jgi:beta-glucosidase